MEAKVPKDGFFRADYRRHVPISLLQLNPNIKVSYPFLYRFFEWRGLTGKDPVVYLYSSIEKMGAGRRI